MGRQRFGQQAQRIGPDAHVAVDEERVAAQRRDSMQVLIQGVGLVAEVELPHSYLEVRLALRPDDSGYRRGQRRVAVHQQVHHDRLGAAGRAQRGEPGEEITL